MARRVATLKQRVAGRKNLMKAHISRIGRRGMIYRKGIYDRYRKAGVPVPRFLR